MAEQFCDDVSVAGKITKENLTIKPERTNATIIPMGGLVPIHDYEEYLKTDTVNIWKGRVVIPPVQGAPDVVYFSRKYQPEVNELDQIFVEIEIEDTELIGVPFLLVPKEKMIFAYSPSTFLHLPKKGNKVIRPHQ